MTEGEKDHFLSWELAIACLRVEQEAGRKLSPQEMIERVDGEGLAMPSARALAQEGRAQEVSALRASIAIAGL